MNVTISKEGTMPGRNTPKRVFTITLSPRDTLRILESPFHLISDIVGNTGVRFQILDRGQSDEPAFRILPTDQTIYFFCSQTGFETDEDHLAYLISLGEIPILINFDEEEIPTGYVRFEKNQ